LVADVRKGSKSERVAATRNRPGLPAARAETAGHAGHFGLRQEAVALLLVGQHLVAELDAQAGELDVDRGQPLAGGFGKGGARTDVIAVGHFEDALLLGRETQLVALIVQLADAREQRLVQQHFRAEGGKPGRDVRFHLLDLGRAVASRQVEEGRAGAVEERAAALEPLDRVGEGRNRALHGDGAHFLAGLAHALLEGGQIMFGTDAVIGRDAVGRGPLVFEQRIGGHGGRRGRGLGKRGRGKHGGHGDQAGGQQGASGHLVSSNGFMGAPKPSAA
jgi:hypothetical protein